MYKGKIDKIDIAELRINSKLTRQGFPKQMYRTNLLLAEGYELDEVRLALKSGLLQKADPLRPETFRYVMWGIPLERIRTGDLEEVLRSYENGFNIARTVEVSAKQNPEPLVVRILD